MEAVAESPNWAELPAEIWELSFRNLSLPNRIVLERVCKKFRRIVPYDDLELNYNPFGSYDNMQRYDMDDLLLWMCFKATSKAVSIDRFVYFGELIPARSLTLLSSIFGAGLTCIEVHSDRSDLLLLICMGAFKNLRILEYFMDAGPGEQVGNSPNILNNFTHGVPCLESLTAHCWLPGTFPPTLRRLHVQDASVPLNFDAVQSAARRLAYFRAYSTQVNFTEATLIEMPQLLRLELDADAATSFLRVAGLLAPNLTFLQLKDVDLGWVDRFPPFQQLQHLEVNEVLKLSRLLTAEQAANLRTLKVTTPQKGFTDKQLDVFKLMFTNLHSLCIEQLSDQNANPTTALLTTMQNSVPVLQTLQIPSTFLPAVVHTPSSVRVVELLDCCVLVEKPAKELLNRVKKNHIVRQPQLRIQHSFDQDYPSQIKEELEHAGFSLEKVIKA